MLGYDGLSTVSLAADGDVVLRIDGMVATVTIDRPAKLNALRLGTWQALRKQIIAADRDPAVAMIVVRGGGRHFSAGNDIVALSAFPGNIAAARQFATAWAEAIQAVEDAAKLVVMAIEGVCYGSALAMSLAGDMRIASSNATFSIPVAKLGALYLRSDFQRLVATIGMGQSKKLIYSSETFGAEHAQRIGLVDEVFAEDRYERELERLIATVLTRSPFTLRESKRMLRAFGQDEVVRETNASLDAFAAATQCEDFAEGIFAFLERRATAFRR